MLRGAMEWGATGRDGIEGGFLLGGDGGRVEGDGGRVEGDGGRVEGDEGRRGASGV